MDDIIYDNIIEAIRKVEPNHVLLNCLDRDGFAMRHQNYHAIIMPDNTIGVQSMGLSLNVYRGESRQYKTCKASLYRLPTVEERIISLIRTYDFQLFLETTDEVLQWRRDNRYIDLWALCQHYGFATPMLDVTYEIGVAAFFATHKFDWRINQYVRVNDGVGVIRGTLCLPFLDNSQYPKSMPIGMQPFCRPGNQDGVALWLGEDGDMAEGSYSLCFKQDPEVNLKLERAMLTGEDVFFPFEPVARIALVMKNTNVVTSNAVERFIGQGTEYISGAEKKCDDIERLLKDSGIEIVDAPLAHGRFMGILKSPVYEGARKWKITPRLEEWR